MKKSFLYDPKPFGKAEKQFPDRPDLPKEGERRRKDTDIILNIN
jgi:hypothetical protein